MRRTTSSAFILLISVFSMVLFSAAVINAQQQISLFKNINNLMSAIIAKYPPPPPCKWQIGPDTCPAYGRPFTGIDGSTECTACTLTCSNIDQFKKNGKTTCQKPYYNYGCHKKFHCVDESAKFPGQFKAAIAFCMLYNGCQLTTKNDATTIKQISSITEPRAKAFVTSLEKLTVEPEFEDLRAFILQLLPSQFLLRFKLVQDIIDAQFKNETLSSFLMRHPLTRVPLPGFITGQTSTTNYLVQSIYLWNLVKIVPAQNLAEAKLTEQVQQIALKLQEMKRKAAQMAKEATDKATNDMKQYSSGKKDLKKHLNIAVGSAAGYIAASQNANNTKSAAIDTARNRMLMVTCNYRTYIAEADEQYKQLSGGEAAWQRDFAGKTIQVGDLNLPLTIGKSAVTLIYPSWKVMMEGNVYFNNPVRSMTVAEKMMYLATSLSCTNDEKRLSSALQGGAAAKGKQTKKLSFAQKLRRL